MPDDPANPAPPTLEYSQRPRLAWTSRHRNLLILVALILAIGGPVWWYWQPLRHRVLWLYWSHRAATYVMPASGEIFVSDPIRAATLLATNPDYVPVAVTPSATQPAVTGALHFPKALTELQKVDSLINLFVNPSRKSPNGMSFVGTLQRPDGIARLVLLPQGSEPYQGIDRLQVAVIPSPRWFDPLPDPTYSYRGYAVVGMGNGYTEFLQLGAASPDPADPAHLIVPFTVTKTQGFQGGRTVLETGTFDVYLRNDDSLLFRMRADSTQSIALRLVKETVISGRPGPTPAPRRRATTAPVPASAPPGGK